MSALDVVAAVIADGDRVLACRRLPERSAGGKWEFPGGKIEPGESAEAALAREIREELSVEVVVGRMLRADQTQVGGRGIRLLCFAATLAGGRPVASTDHDRLEWVRPTELAALDWADPDLPMVRELTAGLIDPSK
ncbi:(deoxy)nucleoside triphosphate pyrophosphohydrolase [Microbacterium terrisoli]|jgi:8-oxo-dGTP diphosphatase|uniref:(deoxy)nucleoside triphosphate pyrophosphohydrolase n=1 Tax=Microbacterium terrisoli TaxID=3242192 RepID=UPI00280470F3|nr:(deoxy)nucleoside triphosphate pyrophosphohydrolase [Microbacterium protaetiae]